PAARPPGQHPYPLAMILNHQARLTANNEKYLQERNDISVRNAACEEELAAVEADIHNQVGRYREVQTAYEQKKRQYEKKESALYQAYQFVQQARSKKDMLETMQGDFSGFYQGVKEVLKQKEQLGGIRGAVLELISTEQKYETAIEIALGAAAQHVVTDDEQAARKAIQYLKQ
ncbi:chromosome segregation protein SMC, partial [Bacillus amyloliquefaciens]|nr:chromosome segregation protein SMC [Bacillus amyloliquefaciens]